MSELIKMYTPEQLAIQRLGARLLLLRLLEEARPDWSGEGVRLWAKNRLKELESEE